MSQQTPEYKIRVFNKHSTFNRGQIRQILEKLPFTVEIADGHELPLEHIIESSDGARKQIMMVDYNGAQVISLRPPEGKRLKGASFGGPFSSHLVPSRIMDELTGGGACCSYLSNTRKLGLELDVDFCVDLYKLG